MKRKLLTALLMVVALPCFATIFPYTNPVINEAGLTVDKNYPFIAGPSFSNVTATVTYGSTTYHTASIYSGQISTGSISLTDADLPYLTAAAATETVTVTSTSGLRGAYVSLLGFQLKNGIEWRSNSTAHTTAVSLAAAIARVPHIASASVTDDGISSSTIHITAMGKSTNDNAIGVVAFPASIQLGASTFTGGQIDAFVTVNGIPLKRGRDWLVGVSSAATATNIATAINTAARTGAYITATGNSPSDGIVSLVSKGVGTNFTLASSFQAHLAVSGSAMYGAQPASYVLGGKSITAAAHGFTTGVPVLYTLGTLAISPLVDQTTYYIGVLDSSHIALATTAVRAASGLYVTLASSDTPASVESSTLVPLAISGTPAFFWESSNDGSTWADLTGVLISSVTITAYTYPTASASFNFGHYAFKWLRLHVTAPTTGGLKLSTVLDRR